MVLKCFGVANLRMNDFEESGDIIRLIGREFTALQSGNKDINS